MNIVFYPIFNEKELLKDFLYRATWYLKPFSEKISKITFYTNFMFDVKECQTQSPKYLDSTISKHIMSFDKLKIEEIKDKELSLENCDYVFVTDESKRNDLIKLQQTKKYNFTIIRVDHTAVQYADSFFLRFAEQVQGLHGEYLKISKQKIQQYLPSLRNEKIYLFGTGPNFSYTESANFEDGLVIACNSMVVNKEIIDRLNPKLFVIADPIFHAGPSNYAQSFRDSFLKVLRMKNNPIVVPLRDYHIYCEYFPKDIVERLIPVIFKNKKDDNEVQNLDIIQENFVTTTSNILTLFQLPLASTLGKEIYISGCDGRPLTHNNYFWAHNKSVQINDKMSDIKVAHPAFFDISYDDYYSQHIETLEKWCQNIEKTGKRVYNLTPSYIPALQSRTVDNLIDKQLPEKKVELSIIIPLYNAGEYLKEAIESLLKSDINNMEILIIDDFSEDNSLALAKEYEAKHDNVFVFQNYYTKGVSGARNTGIRLSRGDVVGFLDADDFVYKNALKQKLEVLKKSKSTMIVHSTVKFVDSKGKYLGVEVGTRREVNFNDCTGNPTSFNTLLFRRKILPLLKFDESLTNGEDWLALAKVLRLGYISVFVKDAPSAYRIHDNSTVIKNFEGHEEKLMQVVDWLYREVDKNEATDKYSKKLKSGSKDILAKNRKFNIFIMMFLSQKLNNMNELIEEYSLANIVHDKKGNFENRLKVPLIRTFVVPIDHISTIDYTKKSIIEENILSLESIVGVCPFSEALKSLLKIDKLSLKHANMLFRSKKYNEAKKLYEIYLKKNTTLKFIEFNIKLCDKRIYDANKK